MGLGQTSFWMRPSWKGGSVATLLDVCSRCYRFKRLMVCENWWGEEGGGEEHWLMRGDVVKWESRRHCILSARRGPLTYSFALICAQMESEFGDNKRSVV